MNINEKNEFNKIKKNTHKKNNIIDNIKQINKSNDKDKISIIEKYFYKIMETLGLDMSDINLKDTPKRIARMYIYELFKGLNTDIQPKITLFHNKYKYQQMVIEKNIIIHSICEHHFLPIIGKAHVGYISNGKIIGLSKINRIVDYLARRPQIQERLTIQIVQYLQQILTTKNVACIIHAQHLCVSFRGIKDYCSNTITSEFCGIFKKESIKNEFFNYVT